MFIDYSQIKITAGHGGKGVCSFRREKFVAKGGPDGGDGGKGGDIIAVGDENINTLINYRYLKHYEAENGVYGLGNNMTGSTGKNRYLRFPLGTLMYEKGENGKQLLCELTEHNQEIIIAKGGIGGRGNARFTSSTNQSPRYYENGRPGEYKELEIELKLMADVGLVGFPNAGKSTLLSVLSAAHPKIADYEFTTLSPSLGVIKYTDYDSFVMADIPGIIEGAHIGKGLGLRFLRHIQRTKTLLFLIDINDLDPLKKYQQLKLELHEYDPYMDKKEHVIAISKFDTLPEDDREDMLNMLKEEFDEQMGEKIIGISSVSGFNLVKLKHLLAKLIKEDG